VALARIGDFAAAQAQIEEALDMAGRTASPVKRADIHIAVGQAYHDMGKLEEGRYHAQHGAELAERVNGLECACAGHLGVGQVLLDQHQLDEARNEFNRSMELSEFSGYEGFVNSINAGLAVIEFEKGSTAAIERLRTAVQNARSLGDEYATAVLSQQLANALIKLGQFADAQASLDVALRHYRSGGMRPYIANALEVAATISEKTGNAALAAEQRAEAAELRVPLSPMRLQRGEPAQARA
jgi:ATP/maltotriose-dependent transcriptional regulator MalT